MLGCWGISTRRGDQYYISSFWFMLLSLWSIMLGKKVKFNVTPKDGAATVNTRHIRPHLIIIGATLVGIIYNGILLGLGLHPSPSGFAANTFWCLFNLTALSIMIRATFWKRTAVETIDQAG
jgi:cellulose synthase (UDP-forming)